EVEAEGGRLDTDVRVELLVLDRHEDVAVRLGDRARLRLTRDLLPEHVDRRELALAVEPPDDADRILQRRARDVPRGEELHHRLRDRGEQADDGAVEQGHGARCYSRMKPWRAALTSATASGKRTRIASRRATACASVVPEVSTRCRAAAVSSTAVLRVRVANRSRCASATDSACWAANSCRLRI